MITVNEIQMLVDNKDIDTLKQLIKESKIVKYGKKLYTKSEYEDLIKANNKTDFYDLKQLIYKILL